VYWNDLLFWLVLGEEVRPIMTALSKPQGYGGAVPEPAILPSSIMASLPIIVIFLALQRFL